MCIFILIDNINFISDSEHIPNFIFAVKLHHIFITHSSLNFTIFSYSLFVFLITQKIVSVTIK